jgi:riboflavin kinase / FMN adenylyltransferase
MSSIEGIVVEGKKIARGIGFPTMNLLLDDNCSFKYGVYAGLMEHNGVVYKGAINIGVTPHFGVNKPKLEIYVFDFNQDMYRKKVKVTPLHFLREEMKFEDMEGLIEQIKSDCKKAKKLLAIY